MTERIHFISGLPRSGSTLLAGILRQNPCFSAAMTSPVSDLFAKLCSGMSNANELAFSISEETRQRVLRHLFYGYYGSLSDAVVFDTSRSWSTYLAGLSLLFPNCRLICCVRNPAWILDSIERQVQKNALVPSKIFNCEMERTIYTRSDAIMALGTGLVGYALAAVRQAWFGEHSSRLILVRYESLTERPAETIQGIYDFIGEPRFDHDFDNVDYDEPTFDRLIGMPGFHAVRAKVEPLSPRRTLLPSDLFAQYDNCFWNYPEENLRGVEIL